MVLILEDDIEFCVDAAAAEEALRPLLTGTVPFDIVMLAYNDKRTHHPCLLLQIYNLLVLGDQIIILREQPIWYTETCTTGCWNFLKQALASELRMLHGYLYKEIFLCASTIA